MSLSEFFEFIEDKGFIGDFLVHIQYKYSWETAWTNSNEILSIEAPGDFMWLNDWNEGQECVKVCGFIPIDDIQIPDIRG